MSFTLRKLVVDIGFNIDTKSLGKVDRLLNSSRSNALALGGAIAGLASSFAFFLSTASRFEVEEVTFKTLIGNAEIAKDKIEELYRFALDNPIRLPEVLENSRLLLAVGIEADKLTETMKTLSEVSAAFGQHALTRIALNYGQVRSQMRLTGRELKDFNLIGVPLLEELQKVLGKTAEEIRGMIFAGDISFEIVEQAFKNMTLEGGKFFNLLEEKKGTARGIMTILGNSISLIAKETGEKLLPNFKDLLIRFSEYLVINKEVIKTNLVKHLSVLDKTFVKLISGLVKIGVAAKGLIRLFGGVEAATNALVFALMTLAGINLISLIGTITKGFLSMTTGVFSSTFLIGASVVGLMLILDDFRAYFEGADSVIGVVLNNIEENYPKIDAALEKIGELFVTLGELISDSLTVDVANISEEYLDKVDRNVRTLTGNIIGSGLIGIAKLLAGIAAFDKDLILEGLRDLGQGGTATAQAVLGDEAGKKAVEIYFESLKEFPENLAKLYRALAVTPANPLGFGSFSPGPSFEPGGLLRTFPSHIPLATSAASANQNVTVNLDSKVIVNNAEGVSGEALENKVVSAIEKQTEEMLRQARDEIQTGGEK